MALPHHVNSPPSLGEERLEEKLYAPACAVDPRRRGRLPAALGERIDRGKALV